VLSVDIALDLVVMVTPDVTATVRACLQLYYDKVVPVDFLATKAYKVRFDRYL